MSHRGRFTNGRDAQAFGCIVSFEGENGAELTLHRTGSLRDGLRDACETARAIDPTLRVVSYSTPQTIYDDLQGARLKHPRGDGYLIEPPWPEASALGSARLVYMAHARVRARAGWNDATQRRRDKDAP